MRRALALLALIVAFGTLAPGAAVAQTTRPELARELARLLVDDTVRRGLDEQVYTSLMQAMSATLQERLSRRLLDVEWGLLSGIVRRFVAQTLPPSRTEEIAAEAYSRHFDEGELTDLLRFQRSEVGRKASRLAPVIATETAQAVDGEIRRSPAIPRMVEELQRAFPVLKPESP
jgi:hypothetical protein